MLFIRSFLFTSWLIFITAFVCISAVVLLPFPSKYYISYAKWWSKSVIRGANFFAGIKVQINGIENLPKDESYIIACKHQSAYETLIFHSFLPKPCMLFKVEMARIPFMGWFLKKAACISVDRKNGTKALRGLVRDVTSRLQDGYSVIIFPEGTRVAPNTKIKYSSGVAMMAKEAGVKVVPVALNSGYLWPRNSFIKKAGTITVQILPPIENGLDKKDFMARLENDIENACANLPSCF